MKRLFFCFLIASGAGYAAPRPTPYVLEGKPTHDTHVSLVTLRNRKSGRAVWQRRLLDFNAKAVQWSASHRALVVEQYDEILAWHEGKPLQEIGFAAVPGSNGGDHYDYSMGSALSPDGRRLLIRFGMSAMSDFDAGRLFCLRFSDKGGHYFVLPSNHYIKEMKWRSNRVAVYRPFLDDRYQHIGQPRVWRVP